MCYRDNYNEVDLSRGSVLALVAVLLICLVAGCQYFKPLTTLLPGPAVTTTTTQPPPSVTTTTVPPVVSDDWLGTYIPQPRPSIAVVHFRSWDQHESMGSVHPDTVRLIGPDGTLLAEGTKGSGTITAQGDWFSATCADLPQIISWQFVKAGKTTRYAVGNSGVMQSGIKPE